MEEKNTMQSLKDGLFILFKITLVVTKGISKSLSADLIKNIKLYWHLAFKIKTAQTEDKLVMQETINSYNKRS